MLDYNFDAFFFDMDGTLINFGGLNIEFEAMYRLAKKNGFSEKMSKELAEAGSRGARIKILGMTEEEYERNFLPKYPPIDREMRKELLEEKRLNLNEGALSLLEMKKPKALISSSPAESIKWEFKLFGLEKYFEFTHGRTFVPGELRKPKKELAETAAKALGVEVGPNIGVIGDGKNDAEFCERAGMTFLNVYKKVGEPKYFFKDLTELGKWLGVK